MRGVSLGLLLALTACGGGSDEDGDGIDAPLDCNDKDANVKPGAIETCDGIDNDCNGVIDDGLGRMLYPDADGDGYGDLTAGQLYCDDPDGFVEQGGDCDDVDPNVNPGATEDCTEVDLNCDGDATLGATPPTWYVDADGDGYGRSDVTLSQCEAPSGYASADGDCNDEDDTVSPGLPEVCDGLDNDCNDTVDDNATDAVTVYVDGDGDGYGDDATALVACPAVGQVVDGGDCDDLSSDIHPGAAEVCDGGIDNDCDPATDEDVVAGTEYYVDADSDGFGVAGSSVFGCEQPAYSAVVAGDCDDTEPLTNPDGTEVCGGGDEDCDGTVDNNASDADSYYPDVDGDTYGDMTDPVLSCTPVPGRILEGTDCDDGDASVNPDTVWYTDADADLHGDPLLSVQSCLQPVDAVAIGDDCDDSDPTSYPGNIEICDGYVDNDCDPSTDEDLTAVWYYDGDGDGYGTEANTVNGCTPPPGYIQIAGDCDDTDPSLNPTATPNCVQDHCGIVSLSQTWKSTVEHTVSCDVAVEGAAKPTLTVQDGAIVSFAANTELRVGRSGEGRLVVQGASTGVTFTSAEPFPIPGDWDGVLLGANDQGSDLVGLLVEYAGNNGKGGIVIEGGDPVLEGVTSQWNLGDGLHILGSEPLVTASVFADNTDNGLYVGVGAGLSRFDQAGTLGPSFQDNLIVDNGGRPVTVPGSHADEIDLTNVISPNTRNEFELLEGTLRFTGNWFDHSIPYVVAAGDVIKVEDGPQARLYVEDGVDIYFNADAEIQVGEGAEGTLEIVDGPEGVLFSATQAVIALSDNWKGVKIGANDAGSLIQNLTIEYGGGNGKGNLWAASSAPMFRNVVSQLSDSSGLYVSGTAAAPDIADSQFVDNDVHGVYVESTSGIARSILGPTFANNTLTGNGQSSVVMPPNFLGELDPSTTFTGNGARIGVHAGDVLGDALWRSLDEDYQVQGTIDIGGPQDPVIEIQDGVTMWFERNTRMTIGTSDDGSLVVDADNGVTFTSADAAPGEGDWHGLEIGRNGALRAQTRLRNVTVEYAGGNDVTQNGGGAIELVDRDQCSSKEPYVDLDSVTILASSKSGLWFESYTMFSADDFLVSGALEGCFRAYVTASCPVPDVVSFSGNDCLDGVVFGTWPLAEAGELDAGNTFPGPVVIDATKLETSATMPALPVPYLMTELVAVKADGNPVLTVGAGAELQFTSGAGLEVADGKLGGLVIEPGALLTSAEVVPSPGDWEGVTVFDDATVVDIQGATIEYGGGNFTGALWLDGAAPTGTALVDGTAVTDSLSCGVYLDPTSTVLVQNMTYAGNVGGDLCP